MAQLGLFMARAPLQTDPGSKGIGVMQHPWQRWYTETRQALAAIPTGTDEGNYDFLQYHYKQNQPLVMRLPHWPALDWTIEEMLEKVGDVEIEYQARRTRNKDYELQSSIHRARGTFGEFIDQMMGGPANDVYITANNHPTNTTALAALYEDIGALPPFLWPGASAGFLWMGNTTVTPLHHDLTNNLMCQVMGDKLIRCVAPDQFERIEYNIGVHSYIGWLTEARAAANAIEYTDFRLHPGDALFLPVGWWHCVRTEVPAITVVYTSFLWNNSYHANFCF